MMSFDQLDNLLGGAPDAILCADERGLVLWCNAGAEAMFGHPAAELIGLPMRRLLPERYHTRHQAWLERARAARAPEVQPESVEVEGRRADGVEFPIEFSVSWSRSADPPCFTAIVRDVSERVARDRAARASEERYRTLARNFPNGAVLLFDRDLRYQLADGLGLADVGLSREILEGRTIWEAFPPETSGAIEPYYRGALAGTEGSFEIPFRGRTFLVRVLPVRSADGEVECGLVMTQDVTKERRDRQALQALADQDDLTGLANRRRLHEELEHRHALGQRYGERTALLMIDVDRFKEINDTLGHAAGDEALRSIAAMLRARLRRTDMAARMGGDEFAVLLPHTEADAATVLAAGLVAALRWPGGGDTPAFTVSIGVGELARRRSVDQAVRAVDAAMYEAKRAGGDRWAAARAVALRS